MNFSHDYSLTSPPRLAAIYTEYGAEADIIIDHVVNRLLAQGKQVVGMQQQIKDAPNFANTAQLKNIESGEHYRITQALGGESNSWNIDMDAIEKVALSLAESLSSNLDLVIVNRFGERESTGGGFCCVIQRALELNIPVLTVVNSQWQQRWHDYGGDNAVTLPASRTCVLNWCYSMVGGPIQNETPLDQTQQTDAITE